MDQESWCTVERTASQDWIRAERKHYNKAFDSKVFKQDTMSESKQAARLTNFNAADPSHRERRHFRDKYETQFKM
ncbi:protein SPATA45 homolog [Hydractinia symbiolongicarpus]|uniref:protein SPATA45 homolog n=1 Tax=Hydractinia symbiolongicarpus TaxID=13093 RepID=UPI00254C8243|nr:protein SPATA45 homolog [Hydractinia symbiolongicarpus]